MARFAHAFAIFSLPAVAGKLGDLRGPTSAYQTVTDEQEWINVCYFTNWARDRTDPPNQGKDLFEMGILEAEYCTHFMYAFIDVKIMADGNYTPASSSPTADYPSGDASQDSPCPTACNDPDFQGEGCEFPCEPSRLYRGFEGMNVAMKRVNPNIKTLVSAGGWTFNTCSSELGAPTCPIFSTIAASEELTRGFARNCIAFLRMWGFDGFDLDWEYPVVANRNDNTSTGETPQDYVNYITMLRIMREEFHAENPDNPLLLTAAVGVGKTTSETAYDVAGMSPHLDLITLMTYDMDGAWNPFTGCHAPLFSTEADIARKGYDASASWAVDNWISRGARPDQLAIGLGMYGRGWRLASLNETGFNAPAVGAAAGGPHTNEAGYWSYYEIMDLVANGATKVHDEDRGCAYVVNGLDWFGFDDEQSITAKVEFAKSRNLAGSMLWALDLDDFAGLYSDVKFPLVSIAGRGGPPPSTSTSTPPEDRGSRASACLLLLASAWLIGSL